MHPIVLVTLLVLVWAFGEGVIEIVKFLFNHIHWM